MSTYLLFIAISLIVIVPTVFVVKTKTRRGQLTYNKPKLLSNTQTNSNSANPDPQITDTINRYRSHPKLPISFRQILSKIHTQYTSLSTAKLAPDQSFTLNKLTSTRLPEVLDDYLALDPQYAENTIIDTEHNLTSQDVTYGQLVSMLEFMQRLADTGQAQVSSNILANRSYLQSVYGEFYQDDASTQTIKAPQQVEGEGGTLPQQQSLEALGQEYLEDCDTIAPDALSLVQHSQVINTTIIKELGQLVYLAERTLTYTDALLHGNVSLQAFDRIIGYTIPNLLRQAILEQTSMTSVTDSSKATLSPAQLSLLTQKITRVCKLLEDCNSRLEKTAKEQSQTGAISPDVLHSLQNTIKSKHSQAQNLLDTGYFSL